MHVNDSSPVASTFVTASDFSSNYTDRFFNLLQLGVESDEFKNLSQEFGVNHDELKKSLTKDRFKSLLSGAAMLYMVNKARANVVKIGIVGLVGYLAYENRYNLGLVSKEKYYAHNTPNEVLEKIETSDFGDDIANQARVTEDYGRGRNWQPTLAENLVPNDPLENKFV